MAADEAVLTPTEVVLSPTEAALTEEYVPTVLGSDSPIDIVDTEMMSIVAMEVEAEDVEAESAEEA